MKTILITGANGGIGAAMVDKFAAHGWRMAASVRKPVEDPRENVSTIQMDTAFEPGAIKAGAAFNSRCERGRPQSDLDADYEAMVSRFEAALELYQSSWATEPEVVASRLFKLANMRRPPTTCYASYDATLLNTVKRLLPERLFRKLVQLAR
jgi:hypothetical protein